MSKKDRKKDSSPIVVQREKIKSQLTIKPFQWTQKQQQFIELALDKKNQIIFCKSPPGTGKTLLATFCSLQLLNEKRVSSILYLRNPVESVGKGLGFTPGDISEKLQPYEGPLKDHLNELLPPSEINNLINDKRVVVESIGYIKGRTYHNIAIISDESEDLNIQELRLLMGRLGKFGKLFIIGDIAQSNVKNSGFEKVFKLFQDEYAKEIGIVTFEFTKDDCMRNNLLKFIIERFDTII